MRLQDIMSKKSVENLEQIRLKLRTEKAKELFGKLRRSIKRDSMLTVTHKGKIKKVFYCGKWYRPVIINDKLCLLGNGETVEYIT